MDKSAEYVVTGTMTAAHGQANALTYAVKSDGTVLFHDHPRSIYGACRVKLNLDAIREMAEGDADFWDGDVEEIYEDELHTAARDRVRSAYLRPEWDSEKGGYRYETGYGWDSEAQAL